VLPAARFQVEELGFQIAPVGQQKPHPAAAFRLDVGLAKPAGARDVGNAERIGDAPQSRCQPRAHRMETGFSFRVRWNAILFKCGGQARLRLLQHYQPLAVVQ
jgi:hypothetical protein